MSSQSKFPASADYPELSKHNNWMSKCLTPEIYEKLRDKVTPNGYTLDECIQTGEIGLHKMCYRVPVCQCAIYIARSFLLPYSGVDNPGHPFIMTVGCVAGDEESYEVFADLLDPIIDGRHAGYKPVSIPMIVSDTFYRIIADSFILLHTGC